MLKREDTSLLCKLKVLNPFDRDGLPIQSMRDWGCIEIDGIWDTGCTTTSVDARVAKMLNLHLIGMRNTNTAAGLIRRLVYVAGIVLEGVPGDIGHFPICVGEVDMSSAVPKALIGMDIIRMGEFAISHNKFSWCCPPCGNPVDLNRKAEKENEKMRKKQRR